MTVNDEKTARNRAPSLLGHHAPLNWQATVVEPTAWATNSRRILDLLIVYPTVYLVADAATHDALRARLAEETGVSKKLIGERLQRLPHCFNPLDNPEYFTELCSTTDRFGDAAFRALVRHFGGTKRFEELKADSVYVKRATAALEAAGNYMELERWMQVYPFIGDIEAMLKTRIACARLRCRFTAGKIESTCAVYDESELSVIKDIAYLLQDAREYTDSLGAWPEHRLFILRELLRVASKPGKITQPANWKKLLSLPLQDIADFGVQLDGITRKIYECARPPTLQEISCETNAGFADVSRFVARNWSHVAFEAAVSHIPLPYHIPNPYALLRDLREVKNAHEVDLKFRWLFYYRELLDAGDALSISDAPLTSASTIRFRETTAFTSGVRYVGSATGDYMHYPECPVLQSLSFRSAVFSYDLNPVRQSCPRCLPAFKKRIAQRAAKLN